MRTARRAGDLQAVTTLASLEVPARARPRSAGPVAEPLAPEAEVYAALRTGLRDYADKNGFERVVFGLSGGIDSALVAMLAVDALGPDRVTCVVMPSHVLHRRDPVGRARDRRQPGHGACELAIEPAMEAYERHARRGVRRAPSPT